MERAQISIEYSLILAFAFVVLVPGIYFFFSYSQHASSTQAETQFDRLGQEMLATAGQAADQGVGSWLTLDADIPAAVEGINVSGAGSELVISYGSAAGDTEAVFFSDDALCAPPGCGDGTVFSGAPHGGKTSFRFTSTAAGILVEERYG